MDVRIDTRIHEPGCCWMTSENRVIGKTCPRRICDASPEQGRRNGG